MQVNRVATMDVKTVQFDEPVRRLAERMERWEVGFLPVLKDQQVVGVVTDRDIAIRAIGKGVDTATAKAEDVMSRSVHWVYEDAEFDDATRVMAENGVHRLLVKDHKGQPVGVLSLDDVAMFTNGDATTGRLLQKIVESGAGYGVYRVI